MLHTLLPMVRSASQEHARSRSYEVVWCSSFVMYDTFRSSFELKDGFLMVSVKNENLLFLTDSYVEMGVLFWREKIRLIIIDYILFQD